VKVWSCIVTMMHLGDANMMVGHYQVFQVNSGIVSWSSKKQTVNALSTAEAECTGLSYYVQESIS